MRVRLSRLTERGLHEQRYASGWGVIGAALLLAGLIAWIVLGTR